MARRLLAAVRAARFVPCRSRLLRTMSRSGIIGQWRAENVMRAFAQNKMLYVRAHCALYASYSAACADR